MTAVLLMPHGVRGPRRRVSRGLGMSVALGWSLAVAAAAVLVPPAAVICGPAYLLGVAAMGVLWLGRDIERLVEAALWLWVLAPGVRRCVDLSSGFHQNSVVLLAAPLLSLVCGGAAVRGLLSSRGPTARLPLRVAVLVCYAGAVAVVLRISVPAVAVAALQVLAPLGLAAALSWGLRHHEVLPVVERFALWVPLLVGGYGVVQYVVAPRWDRQWLIDVSDVALSFGRPAPFEIRVFSTVNDPGSLAVVLVLCLLLLLTRRRSGALGTVALVLGAGCLGLTLVRSAWILLALALLFLLLRGWVRPERLAAVVISLAMGSAVLGTAVQPVVARFQSSTSSGTQDQSYRTRVAFQSVNLVPALLDPFGSGLGSTGTAVRRDAAADQSFANTDSGYLELLRTYGGPLGGLLVVSILGACWSAARRRRRWVEGAAAYAVVMPVQLIFSNVLVSVTGVAFWCALVLAGGWADSPERS